MRNTLLGKFIAYRNISTLSVSVIDTVFQTPELYVSVGCIRVRRLVKCISTGHLNRIRLVEREAMVPR